REVDDAGRPDHQQIGERHESVDAAARGRGDEEVEEVGQGSDVRCQRSELRNANLRSLISVLRPLIYFAPEKTTGPWSLFLITRTTAPLGSKPARLSPKLIDEPLAPMTPSKPLVACIAARIFSLSSEPARLIASAARKTASKPYPSAA